MKGYSLDRSFQLLAISKLNLLSAAMQSSLSFHFSKIKRIDERVNIYQNVSTCENTGNLALNSDFYWYIKNNRKQIESELETLFSQYKSYKNQVDEIGVDLKKVERVNNKVVEKDGVICFNSSINNDDEFLQQLKEIESESENLLSQVELEQKQLLEKTDSLILQMRKLF